ncbi:hypothetical protein BHM03_00060173 [Ensete ventricosum]|nr:hypothetical protein BHM03_00060173 [Ensete ventricosum]
MHAPQCRHGRAPGDSEAPPALPKMPLSALARLRMKCTRHATMKTSCPHLGPLIHPSALIDLCLPPPPPLYSRNALRDPNVTAFFRLIHCDVAFFTVMGIWVSSESCVEESLPKGLHEVSHMAMEFISLVSTALLFSGVALRRPVPVPPRYSPLSSMVARHDR